MWSLPKKELWRSFIFPESCLVCEADLSPQMRVDYQGLGFKFEYEHDPLHRQLCADCFFKIGASQSRCLFCGRLGAGFLTCGKCQRESGFRRAIAAGSYSNPLLRRTIWHFKYRLQKELAVPLGALLSEAIREPLMGAGPLETVLVSVPLHSRRERWRGFNQAELLARVVGRELTLPLADVLKRVKDGPPLAKVPESQRAQVVRDVYQINNLSSAQRLIVVDDVLGTGATLKAVGRVLRKALPKAELWAAVVAA